MSVRYIVHSTRIGLLGFVCTKYFLLRLAFNNLFVQGMTNTKAREMLDSGYRMPAPEGTPDEMYKLMLKCWNYEAEARPHFEEIHSKIDILFSRYVNR